MISDPVNLLVPMDAVRALSVPPVAITDGSTDPVWVELPCRGGYVYGRRRMLTLPFDAATAAVARRWLRLERRRRTVVTPIVVTLLAAAFVAVVLGADTVPGWAPVLLYMASVLVQAGDGYVERKVLVRPHPELIGRLGVYLPAVSAEAARAWIEHNASVRVVSERPPWRRYPSLVYRWAAGSYAVAAVAVWWFALRDGEFGLVPLCAFVVLLGAVVVSAVKAVPVGVIRFGDAPGPP
ncbi:hypothetical protein ACWEOZ_18480 [Actinoplanes sp. NPDC004185]